MQLGMIGLGRMGANMVRRLMRAEATAAWPTTSPRRRPGRWPGEGSPAGTESLDELVAKLAPPRDLADAPAAWSTRRSTASSRSCGRRRGDRRRQLLLPGRHRRAKGSAPGAPLRRRGRAAALGLERGYCLMIGGETGGRAAGPALRTLAPGTGASCARRGGERRHRRARLPALRPVRCRALREDGPQRDRVRDDGRLRRGTEHPRARRRRRRRRSRRRDDAAARSRALPVRLAMADVAEVWRRGSVISSWLFDLTARVRARTRARGFAGRVSDSGEGRWTWTPRSTRGFPRTSWPPRCSSDSDRGARPNSERVLSAMRYEFGGHLEKSTT